MVCLLIQMFVFLNNCQCLYYRDLEGLGSPIYSVSAHESIINAIDGVGGLGIGGGAPEIVTGSRDGT